VNKIAKKMISSNPAITIDIFRHLYRYNSITAVKDLNLHFIEIVSDKFPPFEKEKKIS
jgi:hypothetical protein